MKFSYKWIRELSDISVAASELADLFSAKSFEVKEIVPVGDDHILDIDVLPNRPDALSHEGLAREAAALTGGRFERTILPFPASARGSLGVTIADVQACQRYSALIIRGVSVGASPEWLVKRLESLGLQSINNIVDATNFVMLELGQPLHAFDLSKVDEIVVRPAKEGEHIVTLDEARTEYELPAGTLVISDSKHPLAIAGVKGGADSGISQDTVDILIESANFFPQGVRAASRGLRLRTDASVRFSYGVDAELTLIALSRVAKLVAELAGGKAESHAIDVYPAPQGMRVVPLDTAYTRSLLGQGISDEQQVTILSSLGFAVEKSDPFRVTVPSWRLDVERVEDLVEEIGRVYGYERITSRAPVTHTFNERAWVHQDTHVPWDEYEFIRERSWIIHQLAAIGFSEVSNYAFISEDVAELLALYDVPEVKNPLSVEYRFMRTSLLPRMVRNVADNQRYFSDIRLVEAGHVFGKDPEHESRHLALVLAKKDAIETLFFDLKAHVDHLMNRMGVTDVWYDDAEPFKSDPAVIRMCIAGRRAEIKDTEGDVLGFIGALNPLVADRFKIRGQVAVAEFDLRALVKYFEEEREFEPLPKYPAVVRDISILVEQGVTINQLLKTVETADDSDIVEDVDVIDIFEPESSEPSRHKAEHKQKSVTFRIVYRSPERTLTDAEVSRAEGTIKKALEEELEASIR